jgi:hypothetical protein
MGGMLMSSFTGSLVTAAAAAAAAAAAEVMGAKVALIVERTGCLRIENNCKAEVVVCAGSSAMNASGGMYSVVFVHETFTNVLAAVRVVSWQCVLCGIEESKLEQ